MKEQIDGPIKLCKVSSGKDSNKKIKKIEDHRSSMPVLDYNLKERFSKELPRPVTTIFEPDQKLWWGGGQF